ncbi:acyltransferase family protein [Dietzia aerolata]|uniref:acyltransferase family protein n=1 Tax=Dietzia aerolata TaxID=595984 RepID=UPI00363869D2
MSVQGQFYLVALAVILGGTALWRLLVRRGTPKWFLLAVVAAGTAASVWWSVIGQQTNQPLNYYDTASRMWELLIGGLVAIVLAGIVLPWPLRLITTAAGLFLVVSTGFFFDGAAYFPGPLAWYPIGGALLIVLGGNLPAGVRATPARDPITWLLSAKVFRRLGDISYSLYLWHWPLLILWLSHDRDNEITLVSGMTIIVISLVLALITEKYIERPLRMASRAKSQKTPAAAARDMLWGPPRARAVRSVSSWEQPRSSSSPPLPHWAPSDGGAPPPPRARRSPTSTRSPTRTTPAPAPSLRASTLRTTCPSPPRCSRSVTIFRPARWTNASRPSSRARSSPASTVMKPPPAPSCWPAGPTPNTGSVDSTKSAGTTDSA